MLVNDRAKELLDMEEDPEEGKDIFSLINSAEVKKAFKDVADAEIDLSSDENKKIIKSIRDEVKTKNGKKLGEMRVIRDITLEKEIEEMKERFMHSITHDLKNPLSAIMGLADLLKKLRGDDIPDMEKKYFAVLLEESDRLMGMINDILNLAKLEAGKMELDRQELDVSEMLEKTKDTFVAQAENSDIDLLTDLPEEPVIIDADGKLIKRVVINLLGNALKYTPRNGAITLKAVSKPKEIEVSILDTGEGMPQEMCEKIFDRFQQIKGQSKGGTGIGLNVSKEIIEAHGGWIWAESEIGKGSVFKFVIPFNYR
jgi:signal transduction histidine kinase